MKILTGEQKRVFKKAVKFSRGLYKNNFPELFKNGKDRFEIAINNIDYSDSNSYKLVYNYLKENKYEITDYIKGYATKKDDKNIYKIGKIVKNNKYISDHFRDCVYRQNFKIVISRHPYDIACASWNQDWDSCLDFEDGFNVECINDMVIANSCIIAYMVSATKNTVLGRCFIIPYYNYQTGDYWLYTSDTPYGLFPYETLDFLREWLNKNYNEKYLAPKIQSKDIIVKFKFPNDLVYDNDDTGEIQYFNVKHMNKYNVRKCINDNTIESILRDCYKINQKYCGLELILEETKNWYEYHKSYGRDENHRDMKNKRFLLYWLEGKDPEFKDVEQYFNYLNRHKLLINGSKSIQKWIIEDINFSEYQVNKYLKLIKDKVDWYEGKEAITQWSKDGYIKEGGVAQRRMFAKLV